MDKIKYKKGQGQGQGQKTIIIKSWLLNGDRFEFLCKLLFIIIFDIIVSFHKKERVFIVRRSKIEITQRDELIFSLIKKLGWVRQDDVATFLNMDYSKADVNHLVRNIGYRLQKHDYILKKKILTAHPSYWSFSKFGAQMCGGVAEPKFVLQNIRHDNLVAKVLIDLLQKGKTNVKTEFELKHEVVWEKGKKVKLPDLLIDGRVAVEVELTQKSSVRMNAIVREYKFGKYEEVIYYTTQKIATLMSDMVGDSSKFKFKIIDENNVINSTNFVLNKEEKTPTQMTSEQKARARLGL